MEISKSLANTLSDLINLTNQEICYVVLELSNYLYPTPTPGFDVDIVFSCKEKFAEWLRQQIGE